MIGYRSTAIYWENAHQKEEQQQRWRVALVKENKEQGKEGRDSARQLHHQP